MKEVGKHDFYGRWDPKHINGGCKTFSVGCFQWVPLKDWSGLKKGKVKFRVRGSVNKRNLVYATATEICRRLDAGEQIKGKSYTVKG